jgi:DNA-binding GntR family transcriptional regulator
MARQTKKDLAYDYIKRCISEKRLLPGQRITAAHLADEIGISVLPVREALLKLEAERLVSITPYVGAVVSWVSAEEIYDVIRLLAVLEGYGTVEAAAHRAHLAPELTALNEKLQLALNQGMWDWFIELNRSFHFTIYEAAGNAQLLDSIRVFWSQLDAMLAVTAFHLVPNRAAEDLREHELITRLLLDPATDPWELERIGREHRLRTAAYMRGQSVAFP